MISAGRRTYGLCRPLGLAAVVIGALAAGPVVAEAATPTVSINEAGDQDDPTSASPIKFTVMFSEPVTGFTASDVTTGGSAPGGPFDRMVTGSGAGYTVFVSGMAGSGSVTAGIPAGVAMNGTAESNSASSSFDNTITFNSPPPTVSINQAAGQADPTSASPVNFIVAFSQPVSGFTGGDVDSASSTAAGPLSATVTGGPTVYNAAVSGMTSDGFVVASIPSGVAMNADASVNGASSSFDNTVAFSLPPPSLGATLPPVAALPASPTPAKKCKKGRKLKKGKCVKTKKRKK